MADDLRYDEPAAGGTTKPVATDEVAGRHYQLFKQSYGAPDAAVPVAPGTPLPSRDYHGGTVSFDTGLVLAPVGITDFLTDAVDCWIDVILLSNTGTEFQPFDMTDGEDSSYAGKQLEPGELRILAMHGIKFIGGVKIATNNDAGVRVQVKGTK